jgi:lipopolysaccharide biosynthesis regulator YciM
MRTRRPLVLALLIAAPSACGGESQALRDRAEIKHEVSPRELLRKGDASASIGDMTRAEQYYVMAQKAGGDEHQIVQRLLVACVADQRYPVALEYAERHLRRHPEDVEVRFATASLRAALGDLTVARDMMLEVLRERPTWAEAHYALGSVLRQMGEQQPLADEHDIEYLRLSPEGTYAEAARDRLRRNPQ